jgi:hypothetical protein
MKLREWHFVQNPTSFEIKCDLCGGTNITWSEFEKKIWCYDCKKDTKGTEGIFGGPIPVKGCMFMGISFDKINLRTGEYLRFDLDKDEDIHTGKFIKTTQFKNVKKDFLKKLNKESL